MGIAFVVLYPVLFTETTGAWKLSNRKDRLLIGSAGILAELSIAAIALITWHIFPQGPIHDTAFFLATVSLAGSLLINLNPFMRFDGYYLLSDALGIDNLQNRAFELARWKMRKTLLGWKDPIPETFSPAMHLTLLIYAYGTWIYRFFLFIGIAILVYMLFFKPLGPFLMGIELIFFLGLPIYRELKIWWTKRNKMNWNTQTRILAALLGITILALIIPWRGQIDVPAIIQAKDYRNIHASMPARIKKIWAAQGADIQKGDLLIELSSPDLNQKIKQAQQNLSALKQRQQREETSRTLVQRRKIIKRLIAQAQSTLDGYQEQNTALKIRAPFNGTISDIAQNLHNGRWINKEIILMRLINFEHTIIYGYIHEKDMPQTKTGNTGTFYPDNGSIMPPLKVTMTSLNKNNAQTLSHIEFSGQYGGPLATQDNAHSKQSATPRNPLYAATFTPIEGINHPPPPYRLRGHISLQGQRQSALQHILKQSAALIIRESGF